MHLVALIPKLTRYAQRGGLGFGHVKGVNPIKVKATIRPRQIHAGHNCAGIVMNRRCNAGTTEIAKPSGHHKSGVSDIRHAGLQRSSIHRRVIGEPDKFLLRREVRKGGRIQRAKQAPADGRCIGLRARTLPQIRHVTGPRLVADKIEHIMPFEHAQMGGDACGIAQLSKMRPGTKYTS